MTTLSPAQIAGCLLARRAASMSPYVQTGEIRRVLGTTGFSEALKRRWLVPDYAMHGVLAVSDKASSLHEMQEAMADPQAMDTGDEIQYVGQDGRVYVGVIRNVTPDRAKATVAFTRGTPPGYRDGEEYETNDMKVTKKTLPDARKDSNVPQPNPVNPASPPDQTFQGMGH